MGDVVKHVKRSLLVLVFAVTFCVPTIPTAFANNSGAELQNLRQRAYAAARADDFQTSAQIYIEILGRYKDPLAANNLANQFSRGNGVPKDGLRAIELLKLAISYGYEDLFSDSRRGSAATSIGWIYLTGEYPGVERNPSEALRWTLRGAGHGHTNAYSNLALMYATGFGVPQDPKAAVSQLIRSVESYTERFSWILNGEDEWERFAQGAQPALKHARKIYWEAIRSGDKASAIEKLSKIQKDIGQ